MNKMARSGTEVTPRKARSHKSAWTPAERPISVRFEPEMIKRLDRVASQLSQVNANIRIGRSSVVKLAMERALADMEAELSIVSD
jgi:hypothetical protein